MRPSVAKAVVAGLIATTVLTLIMYFVAPLMLGEPMDIAQMLGDMLGIGWTAGMILHFINGTIVFPLIYVYVLYNILPKILPEILPGTPWMIGLIWGLLLFVPAYFLSGEFFDVNHPKQFISVMGSLIWLMGHAVWGALLGAIAGGGERV